MTHRGGDPLANPYRYLQSVFSVDGDVILTFSSAIEAFAFYMTDANDFLNEAGTASTKKIELTAEGTGQKTLLDVVSGDARTNGNLQFFGFYNSGPTRYTSIRFINSNPNDVFGLDDLLVGEFSDPGTGNPSVPEPGTLALIGAALAGIGLRKRRQRV